MKFASIVKHFKTGRTGVIVNIEKEYATVIWTKIGMYNPEIINIKELEEI